MLKKLEKEDELIRPIIAEAASRIDNSIAMTKKETSGDAAQILHRRYVKDDPARKASVEAERVNTQVARMIYDLRNDAGITQKELAQAVGTTQSVISRLEDADYKGHSLSMLNRIAEALKQKMTVVMTAKDPEVR